MHYSVGVVWYVNKKSDWVCPKTGPMVSCDTRCDTAPIQGLYLTVLHEQTGHNLLYYGYQLVLWNHSQTNITLSIVYTYQSYLGIVISLEDQIL